MIKPRLRRFLSGAWLDVQSLPARMVSADRRSDPWQWKHNIGGGDFRQAGLLFLEQLQEFACLTPQHDVLDIGCGTGRAALPLARFLTSGRYTGFDVSPEAIRTCRRYIGRLRPEFVFEHAALSNYEYTSGQGGREADYRFPVQDQGVDVVFAFSVFSHMQIEPIRSYIREAGRVLRPGGRFLATAYLLTPERIAALERGEGSRRFKPWQGGAMVMDPLSPERAIAHSEMIIGEATLAAGLQIEDLRKGAWIGEAQYSGGQDMVVLRKPE